MMTAYNNFNPGASPENTSPPAAADSRSANYIQLSKLVYRVFDKLLLIILAAAVCGVLMGFFASRNSQVRYSASAQVFLATNVDALESLGLIDLQLGDLLKTDYIAAYSNRHVHEEVIRQLNLPYTPEEMGSMISAMYSEDSHLIYVYADGSTPQEAVDLANTYINVATSFVSGLIVNDTAAVWETAESAVMYETMPTATYLRYGVFIGAVAATLIVVLMAIFDDRIRVPEEINKPFNIPVMGVVTRQKRGQRSNATPILLCSEDSSDPYAFLSNKNLPDQHGQDMISTIAANLRFSIHHKNVIAITSSGNRDGKSYLTLQLARTLAASGKSVVVLDGDLRKSTMKKITGSCFSPATRFLEDYLTGTCDMDDCICHTNVENLRIIPCHSGNVNPIPMLNTPEFAELIQVLSEEYDLVLVDTPNAVRTVDAANIIHLCDGVIFVATYGRTKQRHVRDMIWKIEMAGSPILGAIINKVRFDCIQSRRCYWLLRQ